MIDNRKYSILSFVPKVLYYQFSMFYNFFFLMISVMQLYPPLKVGYYITYVLPLGIIIMFALAVEGW